MEIRREYPCHGSNYRRGRGKPLSYLVIHYVGAAGGARANARYYGTTANIGASAHYFVGHGPEAEIWASVPEGDTAWHCGRSDGKYKHPECRNANSIGIELCCHQDGAGRWYIDEETYAVGAALARDIMARYGIPMDHVLRHYDVTGKLCPRPLIDGEAWAAFKSRLEVTEMTQAEFNRMLSAALVEGREKPASPWAEQAWSRATAAGVFDGTAPQNPLTREQAALLLERLGLLDLMKGDDNP